MHLGFYQECYFMSTNSGSSNKVEFWTAAVELFRGSGLSCTEFCNREGLSYSTFCRWRDRLMNQQDKNTASAKPKDYPLSNSVESAEAGRVEEVKFVSAGVIEAGGGSTAGIEVRFSSGVSINVCKGFDRAAFRDVVSILGAQLC